MAVSLAVGLAAAFTLLVGCFPGWLLDLARDGEVLLRASVGKVDDPRFAGMDDAGLAARVTELIAMAGLEGREDQLAAQLSGGWKQRLALGCAIVHRPPLLFLDEPTAGVDPVSRREFWKLLSEFLSLGLTIIMATPYLDEAERCSRVALLHEGRLLALVQQREPCVAVGQLGSGDDFATHAHAGKRPRHVETVPAF